MRLLIATTCCLGLLVAGLEMHPLAESPRLAANGRSLLDDALLITWYGNPHVARMGALGQATGEARARALREQMDEYAPLTNRTIVGAYHLVAVVAQPDPGADGMYRRREFPAVIDELLEEAKANGFKLILDLQPGRSPSVDEVRHFRRYLEDPDVHVALDPEFVMPAGRAPGEVIGSLRAAEINPVIELLETIVREGDLPNKILILHQFTLNMLPDKERIRTSPSVDLVLMMDGIGSPALKRDSYRAVMHQRQLDHAGFKIFYEQDTDVMSPADVLALTPKPIVICYQ
jgi:hypothetical protein